MSTIDDQATELEEFHRELALKHRKYSHLQPKRSCHNCYEPLAPNLLFCDADCGIDFDKRQRNATNTN
jgi:hypothetical protein